MKRSTIIIISVVLLFSSCAKEFNNVYKSNDYMYKYEYAKECFATGKYTRAATLLSELINLLKGTDYAEESLYMLGMAQYNDHDYESASDTFKRYYSSYPKGIYAESAEYYVGQALYMSTPEPRLDQSRTVAAISAFQEYLDVYPDASMKAIAQQRLFSLQDNLVQKELYSAQLYYDLGSYFGNCTSGGNNYEACVITSQNALKDYPYSKFRENFSVLIMKSKYELAQMSIEEKKLDRFQDAQDECYGFINEFPDSKEKATAEKYIEKCKDYITSHENEADKVAAVN
ncbi:MAG: outer membrane protein assembly factor BamD [Prevotella sp.]|nr:outer membrane protein assembly factor BamD [Prevotella sp.]MCI1281692.1 outer membrane protein assembly factor BamD [Prevotella sp.]